MTLCCCLTAYQASAVTSGMISASPDFHSTLPHSNTLSAHRLFSQPPWQHRPGRLLQARLFAGQCGDQGGVSQSRNHLQRFVIFAYPLHTDQCTFRVFRICDVIHINKTKQNKKKKKKFGCLLANHRSLLKMERLSGSLQCLIKIPQVQPLLI
jgi:hypothetical protein